MLPSFRFLSHIFVYGFMISEVHVQIIHTDTDGMASDVRLQTTGTQISLLKFAKHKYACNKFPSSWNDPFIDHGPYKTLLRHYLEEGHISVKEYKKGKKKDEA
jgi:hypothetical protein